MDPVSLGLTLEKFGTRSDQARALTCLGALASWVDRDPRVVAISEDMCRRIRDTHDRLAPQAPLQIMFRSLFPMMFQGIARPQLDTLLVVFRPAERGIGYEALVSMIVVLMSQRIAHGLGVPVPSATIFPHAPDIVVNLDDPHVERALKAARGRKMTKSEGPKMSRGVEALYRVYIKDPPDSLYQVARDYVRVAMDREPTSNQVNAQRKTIKDAIEKVTKLMKVTGAG